MQGNENPDEKLYWYDFFISHDVRLIENIADRIYKIEEGKIILKA